VNPQPGQPGPGAPAGQRHESRSRWGNGAE
jgi:hypothetical protein